MAWRAITVKHEGGEVCMKEGCTSRNKDSLDQARAAYLCDVEGHELLVLKGLQEKTFSTAEFGHLTPLSNRRSVYDRRMISIRPANNGRPRPPSPLQQRKEGRSIVLLSIPHHERERRKDGREEGRRQSIRRETIDGRPSVRGAQAPL